MIYNEEKLKKKLKPIKKKKLERNLKKKKYNKRAKTRLIIILDQSM